VVSKLNRFLLLSDILTELMVSFPMLK